MAELPASKGAVACAATCLVPPATAAQLLPMAHEPSGDSDGSVSVDCRSASSMASVHSSDTFTFDAYQPL